ncbi:Pectinesterase inhibitor 3, partial [Cucurbita argyrosperma subsp. argyrosperma]
MTSLFSPPRPPPLLSPSPPQPTTAPPPSQDLIHSSCLQASYPSLCIRTLSSYFWRRQHPTRSPQATLSVSPLPRPRPLPASKRQRAAVDDCVEQIGDSVEELSNTLGLLRHLPYGDRRSFRLQMSNAQTWVSAALTNEDTCLDGSLKLTSNALYMINRLDVGTPAGRKKLTAP